MTFGPFRALASALAVAGGAVLYANVGEWDESFVLGALLVSIGALGLVLRETRAVRGTLEVSAVAALILAGGEATMRRENAIAARAYANRTMQFVDDPLLRYEMKPGLRCGEGVTDSRGMLDQDRPLTKPPGTLRVACLGDSVGGDCSLPHDNACAALESVLREARGGRPVEVLNFSVPGYNTMQEARALELKALPFQPDAVVVLFVINDPYPDLAISHYLPGNLKFEHFLWSAGNMAVSKARGQPVDPFGGKLTDFYESPKSWGAVVVAGFDRIRNVADSRGLPVAVGVFPVFIPTTLPEHHAVYEKVAAEAERHGFVGVDLSKAAFEAAPLESLLKPSRDMIHPNAHAHRLAAEAIARALLERHPELLR